MRQSSRRNGVSSSPAVPIEREPEISPDELAAPSPSRYSEVSVVISRPSPQMQKRIEQAAWIDLRPSWRLRRAKNRRDVPLDMRGGVPILMRRAPNEPSTSRVQLRRTLKRRLLALKGPSITFAPGCEEHARELFAKGFEFMNTYKLQKGVTKVEEAFNAGCSCTGDECDPKRCTCLSLDDNSNSKLVPYRYQNGSTRAVLRRDFLDRRAMIFECSSRCGCSEKCWNRVVQRGRTLPLEIFYTGKKGLGESFLLFLEMNDE